MESFVLIAGAGDAGRLGAKAEAALRAVMPRVEAELVARTYELPELGGTLLCVGPNAPELRSLIDVHATDERLTVVFGKLTGHARPASTGRSGALPCSRASGRCRRSRRCAGRVAQRVWKWRRRSRSRTGFTR